jgi:hypothetical protein
VKIIYEGLRAPCTPECFQKFDTSLRLRYTRSATPQGLVVATKITHYVFVCAACGAELAVPAEQFTIEGKPA